MGERILRGTRQCTSQWHCVRIGNLFPLHKMSYLAILYWHPMLLFNNKSCIILLTIYQQPSMPSTTIIWQKLIAFHLLSEKAFRWNSIIVLTQRQTSHCTEPFMTFQVCSPIKQVCLDLGQSELSCPSSISISRSLAFYAKDWSKWLIFCYFRAGFHCFLSILLCKIQEIWV